jgi:uncharacterized repeat protein (TIGR01451 family)
MAEQAVTSERPIVSWRFRLALAILLAGVLLSMVFLLGLRASPAVVIVEAYKRDSLAVDADVNGVVSPGDTILYAITITNSGDDPATSTMFYDAPDSNTSLVVGSVQVGYGTIISGNSSGDIDVLVDIGTISATTSVAVSFQVTINDPFPPGVPDVVNYGMVGFYDETGTPRGEITDDPDTPGVDYTYTPVIRDPAILVEKQLTDAEIDIVYPNTLTFTIFITNVGLEVDVLPLTDVYDTNLLDFVDASPYPDEDDDDGSLDWYDLTGPAPNGFGSNLLPGQSVSVTVVFTVANDISVTVNTAAVISATDAFGDPASGGSDDYTIINVPTAAEVLYFRVDSITGRRVRLAWATATEIDNVGFKLYRAYESVRAPAEVVAYVPSQAHGGGAAYAHTDIVPTDGTWWYWLVDVDTSGHETFQNAVYADVDQRYEMLYLPLVLSRAEYGSP